MDREFAEEVLIDIVCDFFPSTDLELTPGISDAIDNLIDEIEAAVDAKNQKIIDEMMRIDN